MYRHDRLPILPLFLVITVLTSIQCIPKAFSQDQQFRTCGEPFQCGNLSFGYPFWGGNRPESCGYPGFSLHCQGNVPRFTAGPVKYRILSLVDANHTLTVARDDLYDTNCPQYLHDTALDFNIFSYPNNIANLTLSYNCTVPSGLPHQPNQFSCTINSTTQTTGFFAISGASNANISQLPFSVSCTETIRIPINQAAAVQGVTNTAALLAAIRSGFPVEYEVNNAICTNCTSSGGLCGYNTGARSFACYCKDREYDLACNDTNTQSKEGGMPRINTHRTIAFLLSFVSVGIVTLSAAAFCIYTKRKKDKGKNQKVEAFLKNCGSLAPKRYSYSEIKKITNSFIDKLGQGGYGSVFKGKLSDGRLVAVKVLGDAKGDGEGFINEVASISRTSHVNIVTLLGFCYKNEKKALIYEFMPNGSPDKYIYGTGSTHPNLLLDWNTSYKIAAGIARGLEYLHRGCNTRIVHFDIKPHNILLSEDFCPKISDFGLAKLGERTGSIISMLGARGTIGYIAPEVFCRNFGEVSHKSDVYSYGMMVLEMVGLKRKPNDGNSEQNSEKYFPYYIYDNLETGKDLERQGVTRADDEEIARKMILVGLWCIQTNPKDRPRMSKVVEMLEGGLQSLPMPPKPFLYSPPAILESAIASLTP